MQQPLSNPNFEEWEKYINENNRTLGSLSNEVSKEQLKLTKDGRKRRFSQFINSMQLKLTRRSDFIEVSPLWNTGVYAFAIVSFIFNIAVTIIVGILRFDKLPRRIPLFYESVDSTWIQVDKSLIFIIPILLIAFFILQLKLIGIIFIRDRRLATTILWVTTLLNILYLIAATQIYRLVS